MADNTNNEESILNASVSDQDSEDDYLGFEPYVVAIAEFLTNPSTKPPLNLSIEGEWGSGKSSFMKQLRKALKQAERKKFDQKLNEEQQELEDYFQNIKEQNIREKIINLNLSTLMSNSLKWLKLKLKLTNFHAPTTIWFNAWRHDKAEALWAAFALDFLQNISRSRNLFSHPRNIPHWVKGTLHLYWLRVNWTQALITINSLLFGVFLIIKRSIEAVDKTKNLSHKGLDLIIQMQQQNIDIWEIVKYGFIFIGVILLIRKIFNVGNPKNDLTKYLKSPKYENQIEFVEEFHADFKKIVEAFAGKNKVYVFIDDLDRCEVPKSAELMQAINMMIANDPQLIFILGMDVDKVAAGIAVKYKEIIPYLGFDANSRTNSSLSIRAIEYGYNFFEKFVQIRFQIPQPTKYDFERFLNHISPRKTRKEIIPNNRQNTTPIEDNKEEIFSTETETSTSKEQRNRRIEYIKITTGEDSEVIRNIALMVAPALDYNPRRWKQFINLFRLKAYIAASTNLITTDVSETNSRRYITLEQLGKFTAISIKWPRLIIDLNTDHQLLKNLQEGALKDPADFVQYNKTTKYWGSNPKLIELLRYPAVHPHYVKDFILTNEEEKYSFANVDVVTLLQVSPADDLSSERGIDYTRLRDLLRDGNWKEADYETYQVMLKAVNDEEAGNLLAEDGSNLLAKDGGNFLTKEELLNFPCIDLNTIDKLWVKYSNGQFGFSIQKEIYLSVDPIADGQLYEKVWKATIADGQLYEKAWKKFGDQVGWRVNDQWVGYNEVTFEISAPRGHLPRSLLSGSSLLLSQPGVEYSVYSLGARLVNCNI